MTGDSCLITANPHFKRLIGNESLGYFNNTLVVVTEQTPDEVWEVLQRDPHDFAHVIYDLTLQTAEADLSLHLRGSDSIDDIEEDFLPLIDELRTIKLMYDGKKSSNVDLNIMVTAGHEATTEYIERNRCYRSYKNKYLADAMGTIFSNRLNLPEKTIVNMLKRNLNGGGM